MAEQSTTQADSIRKALAEVNELASIHCEALETHSEADAAQNAPSKPAAADSHNALLNSVMRLHNEIRGPVDLVFSHFESMTVIGSLRTLLDMGVFDAVPLDGSRISAEELSKVCKVDKRLLVHMFLSVTTRGPFKQTGDEEYAHTAMSKAYMQPSLRALFELMVDEYVAPIVNINQFFKRDNFEDKLTPDHNSYAMFHGKGMFANYAANPELSVRFNTALTAQSYHQLVLGIFPFEDELRSMATDEESVVLVDIGGGIGQVTEQIKAACPGLKGRFILQDQKQVLEEITEPLPGIDRMDIDFFKSQPIKGAAAYYIRRCLHDWQDPDARLILRNVAEAMAQHSRLLIAELVIPNRGADPYVSFFDRSMMSFGGVERTEGEWRALLESAGLRLVKIWITAGTANAVIEAALV